MEKENEGKNVRKEEETKESTVQSSGNIQHELFVCYKETRHDASHKSVFFSSHCGKIQSTFKTADHRLGNAIYIYIYIYSRPSCILYIISLKPVSEIKNLALHRVKRRSLFENVNMILNLLNRGYRTHQKVLCEEQSQFWMLLSRNEYLNKPGITPPCNGSEGNT